MIILVTLGTQKQQFNRLLDYIEESNVKGEIIVQAGYTKYCSNKMKIIDFVDYDEMSFLIEKADLIVTHGGTGSIIRPLKKGKKVIACARLKEYGEHVDNHQTEIVENFAQEGYIMELNENNGLDGLLRKLKHFKPKVYESNTANFVEKFKKLV